MYPFLQYFLVERRGFEPLTPTLPVLCAPNCANAPPIDTIILSHLMANVKHFLSTCEKLCYAITF